MCVRERREETGKEISGEREILGRDIYFYVLLVCVWGFPRSSVGKESACDAGDLGLIPELGRSPGEGNGNPHQYSCLEHPTDKGAW